MKIGIFGTGSAFKDFLSILPDGHDIVAVADNNAALHGQAVEGHSIVSAEALVQRAPEVVVITTRAVDAIRAQLIGMGVAADRICAYYPSYSQDLGTRVNDDIARLNTALGTRLPMAGIATMYLWPEADNAPTSGVGEDFVRRHAMRLAAEWIGTRNVAGCIAELGVYQGEQAALLNALFPDRAIHLFDTFEGFSSKDISTEASRGYSGASLGDFQDTSIARVLERLPHSERAVVHAGFFPESLNGLEEQFAFVSLDVDLFEPTLAGLEYFYPRLSPGGFIFVHDYNNLRYSGVRHAVDRFLQQNHVPAMPLPDFAGSLVVMK